MADSIANFPLRNAAKEELGTALGRCYREYSLWHGQATIAASFLDHALAAGVKAVMAESNRRAMELAEQAGIIKAATPVGQGLLNQITDHHLAIADYSGKVAAIVMLHNACERFLWRLVRFGIVGNRSKALTWIAERKVTLAMLAERAPEVLMDEHLDNWWVDLERQSLTKKWDSLAPLAGFPENFITGGWHFDREMLNKFDEVRHDAVHHDGQAVKAFDFAEFANQLNRAQMVWLIQVARLVNVRIPAESAFFGA
jgi:hypothetical protein